MNSILCRDSQLVADRSKAGGVQVGKSGADLVDGVGVEYMGVGRDHLCGFRSLDALLECAAIGNALERSGNKLRVIRIAEAGEDLVLLVGVEILACVEAVGMLIKSGAVLIGSQAGVRLRIQVQQLDRIGIDAELGSMLRSGQFAVVNDAFPGPHTLLKGSRT